MWDKVKLVYFSPQQGLKSLMPKHAISSPLFAIHCDYLQSIADGRTHLQKIEPSSLPCDYLQLLVIGCDCLRSLRSYGNTVNKILQ